MNQIKKRIVGIVGSVIAIVIVVGVILQLGTDLQDNGNGADIDRVDDIGVQNLPEEEEEEEWNASGPFEIDKYQYKLGNVIFVRVHGLAPDEKGQAAFLRPKNETHYQVYTTIPLDGSNKANFNSYLMPALSQNRKICTVDDLIGGWRVVLQGLPYENISFEIIDEYVAGREAQFEPVC